MIGRNALAGGFLLAALAIAPPATAQGYYCPPGFTLVPAYYAPGYACVDNAYLYPPPDYAYLPFANSIVVFDRFRRFDRFNRSHNHDFRVNHFGGPMHSAHH